MGVQVMTERWVVYPPRNNGAKIQIVCIPHAGAGVSAYRSWLLHPPTQAQLAIVRLPGRESRVTEAPITDMPHLANTLAAALTKTITTPYILFGHCLGALIAFELARHLMAIEAPQPVALCVSSFRAPHILRQGESISQLSDSSFLSLLGTWRAIPAEVLNNAEMRAMVLPTLRADFALLESYRYQVGPPLRCPIVLFFGKEHSGDTEQNLMEWRMHTLGDFYPVALPGDQDDILQQSSAIFPRIFELVDMPSHRADYGPAK